MANQYPEQLRTYLSQVDLADDYDIQVKPFFGGAAAWANGKICLSLTKVGFAVKLPAADRRELLQLDGAQELQYFPNAPVKKAYAVLPHDIVNDPDRLRHWVIKAIAFVTSP